MRDRETEEDVEFLFGSEVNARDSDRNKCPSHCSRLGQGRRKGIRD